MESPHDDAPLEPRPPLLKDLVDLCRRLNAAGARYVVVGGMAIIQHGFVRATEDIDLLVQRLPGKFRQDQNRHAGPAGRCHS